MKYNLPCVKVENIQEDSLDSIPSPSPAIFSHMGSSKGAAQKHPIMSYEQLLSLVFSCFHGLKNNFKQF